MKKKWIWGVGAVILLLSAIYMVNTGKQPLTVEMAAAEKGVIEKAVEETAEVRLLDKADIYSTASGLVTEVKASLGAPVKKGDLLIQLDDEAIKLQIKDLEAQIQSVRAQYEEAKAPSEASELKKLTAALKSAQTAYDESMRRAASSKTLYESGSVSQDIYQSALSDVVSKEASLMAARSNLEAAEKGLSDHVKTQYNAQLEGLKARLDLYKNQLEDLTIVSPLDGVILTLEIEKGNYIQPGKLVMEIGDPKSIYLSCDVLIEDMGGIKVGTPVVIDNEKLDISELKGTVTKIFPVAFSKPSDLGIIQKRVTIEISVEVPFSDLKPGYELDAKIIVEKKNDVILIDKKAVFDNKGQSTVFVNANGIATLRTIETGMETDNVIEVLKGLDVGESVILSPDETIKEGLRIQ